jgi:hypothetical protein
MVQFPTFQRLDYSAHTLAYHCRGFGKVRGGRFGECVGRKDVVQIVQGQSFTRF